MTDPSEYVPTREAWEKDRIGWWSEASRAVDWIRAPRQLFEADSGSFGRWFPDAELNVCANCLDRHADAGRHDQVALIWDSPMEGLVRRFTYGELRDQTARLAGALANHGVGRGDRVVITMPMVPEAAMAMLACARLGAIHVVVFGGFAAAELARRIEDAEPVAVISASCGMEPGRVIAYKPILDAALAGCRHRPRACLILQRPMLRAILLPGRDHDLVEAMADAIPVGCVPMAATDPLYILYTSGTTGQPKGMIRDCGGYAVALQASIGMIYGLKPGGIFWAASDVGWVVGHSYIVYAPLLAGLTTVLYEGKPVGTPDAGAFWRVCADHQVQVLLTAPTALRAIRQQDPDGLLLARHAPQQLEALFLAGEHCDSTTARWIGDLLGRPVIDHWWQTETGWPITANFRGLGLLPIKSGSGGRAVPGYEVAALDGDGRAIGSATTAVQAGRLVIRLPLPPGCAVGLWNGGNRFEKEYLAEYPGWYCTGDAGAVDADGDVWVMGRTDDVINVAGHRLSTGEMEEAVSSHRAVAECAVVAVRDAIKGHVPLGLVVLKDGYDDEATTIESELVALVRSCIGPVAAFRRAVIVKRLPRTRSGKILRASLRRLAAGEAVDPPATAEDPNVFKELGVLLQRLASPTA